MRGGALPPALLLMALGLALSCAPRRGWVAGASVLLASLGMFTFVPFPAHWIEGVFLGCWISVIVTAAVVQVARRVTYWAALALAFNAGFWASAVVCLAGSRVDLLEALPGVLICVPASWVLRRYHATPLKVVASWVIAVAALAATLQLLPITPGYLPDHME